MEREYVKVYILNIPYIADRKYTYFVPQEKREDVTVGCILSVPFGNSDRQSVAVCYEICAFAEGEMNIKPISDVIFRSVKLSAEMLSLCEFMKAQTLCTIGEAVKCIIPSAVLFGTTEYFEISQTGDTPSRYEDVYQYIANGGKTEYSKIRKEFPDYEKAMPYLVKNKYITKTTEVRQSDKSKYENVLSLCIGEEEAMILTDSLKSEKQKSVLELIMMYGSLTDKEIRDRSGVTKATVDSLVKKGILKAEKREVNRNSFILPECTGKKEELELSGEQQTAFSQIKELYDTHKPQGVLLYGVTGSGKTSVIKKMIDEVISDKKGVIILVPEISLTPQTVSVFCGYYGDKVAVIHSNLSAGERYDAYKKISSGEADIVIGTRSAVFAPVKNLGMIVIDEEQEHTYKSETNPKYLAHDIARFRCAKNSSLMLLCSATPSLESYYKALSGKYSLVKLTHRYGEAQLPEVVITDMRKERNGGNASPYGTYLLKLLGKAFDEKKQAILFINRRGYHSQLSCRTCGKPIECPHCSVPMTYHSFRKTEEITPENAYDQYNKNGKLKCHYCGYETGIPKKCPNCKEGVFEFIGYGTQKAEEELRDLFPDEKVLRLDADTTTSKTAYEKILSSFKQQKADVLIGTQMVTKGHDFPKVTLVGVLLADTMLYNSDFRASERTFSMLTQVVGRAGRAKDKGVAVIQTNSPNDKTVELSAKQDYESFYKNEILIRKAYTFPPFCDIALLTFSSSAENKVVVNSKTVLDKLHGIFEKEKIPVIAYGPFEAPVYKINGKYRKRIVIKCRLNKQIREILSNIYIDFLKTEKKCVLSVDFNPSGL